MKTTWCCLLVAGLLLVCAQTASAATSVVAAYEKYVTGKGFDIGLIDTGTGASVAVPAGVNSNADELHPALSSDGRWLVFSRMTLTPQLSGNIVPPAERSILAVDRRATSGVVALQGNGGAGPTATALNRVTWGKRPTPIPDGGSSVTSENDDLMKFMTFTGDAPSGLRPVSNPPFAEFPGSFAGAPGTRDVVSAVSMGAGSGGQLAAYQSILFDPATGETRQSVMLARAFEPAGSTGFFNGLAFSFTGAANTGHPALRTTDKYLAFDESTAADGSGGGSIRSVLLGAAATTLADAPSPINTADDERHPSWSPDNLKLAFVRSGTSGQRKLLVFDLTAGIQTIVNPALDIGALAPNPQLRRFQNVWGGISLAIEDRPGAANPTCDSVCQSKLQTPPTATVVQLKPAVIGTAVTTKQPTGLNIGIVVARVVGSHKVLGRTVPRLRRVGRVPLGAAAAGRNGFRWNGRVAGKRLKAGTYVLTFRTLTKSGRIHSVSQSVRFAVSRAGRISAVTRVKQ
jgi:hypothetical protein